MSIQWLELSFNLFIWLFKTTRWPRIIDMFEFRDKKTDFFNYMTSELLFGNMTANKFWIFHRLVWLWAVKRRENESHTARTIFVGISFEIFSISSLNVIRFVIFVIFRSFNFDVMEPQVKNPTSLNGGYVSLSMKSG